VTGLHRGPKCNLRAGYRVPSLKRMSCWSYFLLSCVVQCAFSAHSKFGHHPYPISYLCAKFCFFCGLRCWVSPQRNITYSLNHSLTHQAYMMPRELKLMLWKKITIKSIKRLNGRWIVSMRSHNINTCKYNVLR